MSADKDDFLKAFIWFEHQRIIFFGVFILGSIVIILLRHLGLGGLATAAAAVSMMFGYVATGMWQKFKVRLDVLGDNVYYLGFLFTLVSLSMSLYQLGAGVADINKLLENFGLAIATTLVGLALRVMFNQPKAEINEYEESVRMSLTEAGANFVGTLSKLRNDFSTARETLKQIMLEAEDHRRQAAESTQEFVAEQRKLLSTSMRTQQKTIDTLVARLAETQDQLNQQFEQKSVALLSAVEKSGIAMATAAAQVQSAFAHVLPALEESGSKTAVAADKIQEAIGYLGKVIGETQALNGEIARQLNALAPSLTLLAGEAEGFSNGLAHGATSLKAHLGSMLDQMSQVSAKFADTMSQISQSINEKVASLDVVDRSLFPQTTKLAMAFDDLSAKLGTLTLETESYLAESRRAVRELQDENREVFTRVREARERG